MSETDTEVIAQLIGIYLDQGLNTKDALSKALSKYCEIIGKSFIFVGIKYVFELC